MTHPPTNPLLRTRRELVAWLRSINAYRNGYGSDRQFYLSVWSGTLSKIDRKASDPEGFPLSLYLDRPFVAVAGTIVPQNLHLLAGDIDDGLIDRFLFAWPVHPQLRRGRGRVSKQAQTGVDRVFEFLWGLEDGRHPVVVRLSRTARSVFEAWENSVYSQVNAPGFPEWLRGPYGKLVGQCARLVLILHLATQATAKKVFRTVGARTVRLAIQLIDYFAAHARRVHEFLHGDEARKRLSRAYEWLLSHRDAFPNGITARDLQRYRVAGVGNASEAQTLLKELVTEYGLQPAPLKTGRGRKAERYLLPSSASAPSLDSRRNAPEGRRDAGKIVEGTVDTVRQEPVAHDLLEGRIE